jgi:hypothetical protein
MPVRANDPGDGISDSHATAHLRDRGFRMVPDDGQRAVLIRGFLRRQLQIGGLTRHDLRPGGIAERAPSWHAPIAAWLGDASIRIHARFHRHLAATGFQRIIALFDHRISFAVTLAGQPSGVSRLSTKAGTISLARP